MRSFAKKLACAVAAVAMVITMFPAAKAEAAEKFALNKSTQYLYVNKGASINVQSFDFNFTTAPKDYLTAYTFAWGTSDEKVATVAKGGVVTAAGVGTATITCKVTEKATQAITNVTAKVIVKENASKVEISNADKYEGIAFKTGDVIDLNRVMYNSKGVKTSKGGAKAPVVTDLTKWVVEPADAATINQANGQFTITDKATGDVKLSCYTYQSEKNPAPVAKSDVVTISANAAGEFGIQQNNLTSFTVKFDAAVKALSVSDVTVLKLLKTANKEYTYNQLVKSVKLADDKMSATIELFASFVDGTEYSVGIQGFDAQNFVASVGKPVSMVISTANDKFSEIVTTGASTQLYCTFYDANGVNVTNGSENVIFRLEKYATDGSYYLAGSKLTIKKEGIAVTVKAEYQGYMENGKRVGAFSESLTAIAVNAPAISVVDVADYTLVADKWDGNAVKKIQVQDKAKYNLYVKPLLSNSKKTDAGYTALGVVGAGIVTNPTTITFEAVTPSICAISSNGLLTPFKAGTAQFYVYKQETVNGKKLTAEPFALISIEIADNSKFSYVTIDTPSVTVGTNGKDNKSLKVSAFDQYDQAFAVTATPKIEGLDDNAKRIAGSAFTITRNDGGKSFSILVDGSKLEAAFVGDAVLKAGDAGSLDFKFSVDGKEITFQVIAQKPANDGNYVQVSVDKDTVNAARVNADNMKDAKTITFKVVELNNGIKVDDVTILEKVDEANATVGKYYYRVTKDGQDCSHVTNNGSSVTVALSTTKTVSNGAISGSALAVDYSNGYGAGVYTFELIKCYEGNVLVVEQTISSVVTVDGIGEYVVAGNKTSDKVSLVSDGTTYNAADQKAILKCLTLKDRNGNDIKADEIKTKYLVNYSAPTGTGTCYIYNITFYEEVATGVYVEYVVTIDDVLKTN